MMQAIKKAQQGIYSYKTQVIDLSAARENELLGIEGTYLFVFESSDASSSVDVRFNETYMDALTLTKSRGMRIPFYRVYLSNTAQPGKTVTLIYGVSDSPIEAISHVEVTLTGEVEIIEPLVEVATAPHIYNVNCVAAATEYTQALPAGTKKFTVKARGGDLQVCFDNGSSGLTYVLLTDGQALSEDNVSLTGKVLYFQSPTAGTKAEIIAWS